MIQDVIKPELIEELKILDNTKEIERSTLFEEEDGQFMSDFTPYSLKKIHLFSYIIDYHLMADTSDVYETPWTLHWKKLAQENQIQGNALQRISLGSTHTLVTNAKGKIFSWGFNDCGKCLHPA